MRLEIERGELLKALSHVTSVVERRTTIPILSNVMLKASGSSLTFKATDLEREVSESVEAKVQTAGALTVPAHMLHDIVRKLPDGAEIELKRDGDKERLTLTSGHSRFSLQTLAADDFPDLAVGEIGHEFTIDASDLKRLIDKTKFAISTEETRYYLNGIYLHVAETGKNQDAARGRDRWPPLGAGRAGAPKRRRRHAGRDHSEEDRARAWPPAGRHQRQGQSWRLGDEGAL